MKTFYLNSKRLFLRFCYVVIKKCNLILRQRFFSNGGHYFWKEYGKSAKSYQNCNPIVVYFGTDSTSKILSSLPSLVTAITSAEKFTRERSKALEQWLVISKSILGSSCVVEYDEENNKTAELLKEFPNEVIDKARYKVDVLIGKARRELFQATVV